MISFNECWAWMGTVPVASCCVFQSYHQSLSLSEDWNSKRPRVLPKVTPLMVALGHFQQEGFTCWLIALASGYHSGKLDRGMSYVSANSESALTRVMLSAGGQKSDLCGSPGLRSPGLEVGGALALVPPHSSTYRPWTGRTCLSKYNGCLLTKETAAFHLFSQI